MRADAHRNAGLCALPLAFGALLAFAWALVAPSVGVAEDTPRGGARIIEYSAGPSDSQAGGHPDIKIHFKVGTKVDPVLENYPGNGNSIKEALVEMPAGFIGNPHATPQCTTADFSLDKCPIDSQVGYVQPGVELTEGCLGNPTTCEGLQFFTPLYNLMPPPDQAGLLGFKAIIFSYPTYTVLSARTGGDFGLNARVTGISQLFTLRSFNQWLWGVPASPVNDEKRFEEGGWLPKNAAPVASNSPEKAFLSSPTTCTGPLSSTFHSLAFDEIEFVKTAPWPEVDGLRPARLRPVAVGLALDQGSRHGRGRRHQPRRAAAGKPRCSLQLADQGRPGHLPRGVLDQSRRRRRQGLLLGRLRHVRHDRGSAVPAVLEDRNRVVAQLGPARRAARVDLHRRPAARQPLPHHRHGRRLRHPHQAPWHGAARPADRPADASPSRTCPRRRSPNFSDALLRLRAGAAGDPDALRDLPGRDQLHPLGRLSPRSAVDPVLRDHLRPEWVRLPR